MAAKKSTAKKSTAKKSSGPKLTALKDFEYWGQTFAKDQVVELPEGWRVDESQNRATQMEDKKTALRKGEKYEQRRAVLFTHWDEENNKGEMVTRVKRAILPVRIN